MLIFRTRPAASCALELESLPDYTSCHLLNQMHSQNSCPAGMSGIPAAQRPSSSGPLKVLVNVLLEEEDCIWWCHSFVLLGL